MFHFHPQEPPLTSSSPQRNNRKVLRYGMEVALASPILHRLHSQLRLFRLLYLFTPALNPPYRMADSIPSQLKQFG